MSRNPLCVFVLSFIFLMLSVHYCAWHCRLSCVHLSPVSPVPSPPLSSALVQGGDLWATATGEEVGSRSSGPVLPVSIGVRWLGCWWQHVGRLLDPGPEYMEVEGGRRLVHVRVLPLGLLL